jgi:ribonuclease HI
MLADTHSSAPYIVNTDGGSRGNPGPASGAYVIVTPCGGRVEGTEFFSCLTNNEAEYEGMIAALDCLLTMEAKGRVKIFSDSQLIVNQILGLWRVKEPSLHPYWERATALYDALRLQADVSLSHVRREFNKEADALCNSAMDEHGATFKRMERQWTTKT